MGPSPPYATLDLRKVALYGRQLLPEPLDLSEQVLGGRRGSDGEMTSDLRMISSSVGDSLSVMRGWCPGHRTYVRSLRLSRHIHRM